MKPAIKAHPRLPLLAGLSMLAAVILFGTAPAHADSFSIGVGPKGGINFSYSSGGYCDGRGCPQDFWDLPVYYCPVYNNGRWYRGPVYYRHGPNGLRFWIRGKWRGDHWRGPRPPWACMDRMGPALGYEYYERHGFRMRPEWRNRWMRQHPHHGNGPVDLRPHGPDRHAAPGPHGPDRHAAPGPRGDAEHRGAPARQAVAPARDKPAAHADKENKRDSGKAGKKDAPKDKRGDDHNRPQH